MCQLPHDCRHLRLVPETLPPPVANLHSLQSSEMVRYLIKLLLIIDEPFLSPPCSEMSFTLAQGFVHDVGNARV